MKKSYSKKDTFESLQGDKKSLLEEILQRNRRKLSRQLLKTSLKSGSKAKFFKQSTKSPLKSHKSPLESTRQSTKSTRSLNKSSKVNTILKSIAFRKTKKSLPILMNYIFKNATELYNELGEVISKQRIDIECKRFNFIEDNDNKKKYAKNTHEDSLKHRQMLHLMYSLPNNNPENKAKLLKLAESFEDIFPGHKFVYGLHSNTNNMHLHIALKCQNDITKKRLRVGGKELIAFNKYLYEKCEELGIDLQGELQEEKEQEKKIVNKQFHKLPDFMKKTAPSFCKKYERNSFDYISANTATLEALKKLKMQEEDIQKFLWLYHENKKQAIYSINNSPKIFGLNKHRIAEYKKQNNGKGFTLRNVEFILKSKEKKVLIEK